MRVCPLCQNLESQLMFTAKASKRLREFHRCIRCDLVFVPQEFHISSDAEKEQYDLHQNEASDERYMQHLEPVLSRVVELGLADADLRILDYGSGPNPVLVETMRARGLDAVGWDPFFNNGMDADRFPVVTSTEVVEHFCSPEIEWLKLDARVEGLGGHLIVMTSLTDDVPSLKEWYYIRDITHVAFYSQKTMRWIAGWLGYTVTFDGNVSHFVRDAEPAAR